MRRVRSVVIFAVALLLTSCAGAGESTGGETGAGADAAPGVTDDSVVIGTHQPLTGPAAPGYSRISVAAKAMYDYINDNGGINGRRIDYRVEDDGYNPTRTVEVVKKLVLQDEVFAIVGGLGTPTHSKVVRYLNQQGVPDLLVSSGASQWDDPGNSPMTFGFQVDYEREGKIQGKYIRDHLGGRKVGLMYQNDDVGRDAQAGLDRFIKADVVSRQGYDPANTDVLPQLSALKDSGAEVVVCSCVPAFTALTILTAARLGYRPRFVVSSIGADPVTLTGLLRDFARRGGAEVSAAALLDGLIGTGYLPDVASDDPWVALFRQVHDRYIPNEPFTNTVAFGLAQAYTFAQALKLAGRDLTRGKLVDALESGKITGPGVTPFAFSAGSHAGYTGAFVFQVNPDTTTRQLQGPMVTDRGSGAVRPAPAHRSTPADIALVGT
ncbi:ABC transporter substrate-binding protein [Actinophytocola sp.]|uniref:ABC transporter substrate-binding protein n=1 Tax=Actinophytocola sp. TaxID=1872138 RepID=UPI002D4D8599|nr:ABC transporter substrate-binding protein [Actinophytocola sp.]HYQ66951.1 ABC transporter substrate-binding protein [Actinophytocola sp.]